MEILKAIEIADALCPNQYTLDEKILWCDEVSSEIRRNIIKEYDVIETTLDKYGSIVLPPGISSELVEKVIIGKSRYEKQDFRSFLPDLTPQKGEGSCGTIKLIYLALPRPIRTVDIRGEFNTGENLIEVSYAPFEVGDKLQITPLENIKDEPDSASSVYAYVLDITGKNIILDRDVLVSQTGAILAINRVIDDVTVINEAPYDRMYIEYILAKISLYQRDYSAYNAHMTQYNSLFESARREYITRNPLTTQVNFKNYSII